MPGPGELSSQQRARIIGREAGLARLRALADPVPLSSQSNREIGDRLFLSPRTVSSHLYRSYPKLGVASRHQLRDVIAGTITPAHESAESRDLL